MMPRDAAATDKSDIKVGHFLILPAPSPHGAYFELYDAAAVEIAQEVGGIQFLQRSWPRI